MLRFNTGIALAMIIALASSSTMAKPHHDHGDNRDKTLLGVTISLADQTVLRDYLRSNYQPHCPPGLAKKHNGCLPPGIAKKYAMGQPLPRGIAKKRLPGSVLDRLHPPYGYEYVQVDRDVLLVSAATQHVVDAVTLLSAVGR